MELLDFQQVAADQIADRVVSYASAPIHIGRKGSERRVPFLQVLSSITASGKTLVLADAVSSIAQQLPLKPVVLWLSKASVVVAQSYANLAPGGAYHSLLEDFTVKTLADYDESELRSARSAFLFFATVGTFNQEKKDEGTLNVFKSSLDNANVSTWDSIKARPDGKGYRRPLIVVYDEAHNLSDRQTGLLLELDPDAFLLATATSRLPQRFETDVLDHLRKIGELNDEDLVTPVDAAAVAASGLIKNEINLVGRQAPMEDVVREMVTEMRQISKQALALGLPVSPKAVYVCKTNVAENSGERDNPKQPFAQRQAPPILIWRHLTEKLKVNPAEIVAYCDLKVDKNYPLPEEFLLLRGGDSDYERFISGNFRHIIFNQSLQEGWDDPNVYLAYVDKSIGSKIQVEQILGRLLRQPGRKHYQARKLNMAQIFVRVEATGVFEEVVASVEERISTGKLDIKVTTTRVGKKTKTELSPKKKLVVPVAALLTERAEKKIAGFVRNMSDYRTDDGTNTSGSGRRAMVQRVVGETGGKVFAWEEYGKSATVLARWLFGREVARIHRGALDVTMTSSADGTPTKFDATIGLTSPAAAHIADVAKKVGEAFVDQVYLRLRVSNPYEVGPVSIGDSGRKTFKNAAHAAYDEEEFNPFELAFAEALDRKGITWCRNPARLGYSIPLPTSGKTFNFYPDFLVWKSKDVFAIDTKGSHLHADAMRKLVSIKPANGSKSRVFVRFVSEGLIEAEGPRADGNGYTVWSFKPSGAPDFIHCDSMADAVQMCLEPDV